MKEETLRQQVVRILPCHVAIKPIHQEEVVALIEETQIQAFNRGCESAQAKAEKGEIRNPGADLVDPEHEVRSAARREAFEALRNIMKAGDNHDRILACRVALETNQW